MSTDRGRVGRERVDAIHDNAAAGILQADAKRARSLGLVARRVVRCLDAECPRRIVRRVVYCRRCRSRHRRPNRHRHPAPAARPRNRGTRSQGSPTGRSPPSPIALLGRSSERGCDKFLVTVRILERQKSNFEAGMMHGHPAD